MRHFSWKYEWAKCNSQIFYIVLTSTLLSLGQIHMTARKLKAARSYLTHLGRKCLGN